MNSFFCSKQEDSIYFLQLVKSFFQFLHKLFTSLFFIEKIIFLSSYEVMGLYELFSINQKFFLLFLPLSFR